MNAESRAAVLEAPDRIDIKRFAIPEITDDTGLLRVEMAGICHTDVGLYHGTVRYADYPLILGHEILGRIEQIGPPFPHADLWPCAIPFKLAIRLSQDGADYRVGCWMVISYCNAKPSPGESGALRTMARARTTTLPISRTSKVWSSGSHLRKGRSMALISR